MGAKFFSKNARAFIERPPDKLVTADRRMLNPDEVQPWRGTDEITVTHAIYGERPVQLPHAVTMVEGDTLKVHGQWTRLPATPVSWS